MNIKVEPFCDLELMWSKVLRDSRVTVNKHDLNKPPSIPFKVAILTSEHSPIRKLKFEVFMSDIPSYVSQHFSRHHIAINNTMLEEHIIPTDVEHFVQTSRTDRTGIDRSKLSQTALVDYNFEINAQGLIDASKLRLCLSADKVTLQAWKLVKEQVYNILPELANRMQPQCIVKGFCPYSKLTKCIFNKTMLYNELREKYINI